MKRVSIKDNSIKDHFSCKKRQQRDQNKIIPRSEDVVQRGYEI